MTKIHKVSFSIQLAISAVAAYICFPSSVALGLDFTVSSTSSNLTGAATVGYYGQSFNTNNLGDGNGTVGGSTVYLQSWSVAVDGADYSSEPIYIHDSLPNETQVEVGFLGSVSSSTAVSDPDFGSFTTYQWDFSSLNGGNGLELQPGVDYYAFWGDGSLDPQIRASASNPYGGGRGYRYSSLVGDSIDMAFKAQFNNESAVPVPWECSPTFGLLLLGGFWGGNYLRKNLALRKLITNRTLTKN